MAKKIKLHNLFIITLTYACLYTILGIIVGTSVVSCTLTLLIFVISILTWQPETLNFLSVIWGITLFYWMTWGTGIVLLVAPITPFVVIGYLVISYFTSLNRRFRYISVLLWAELCYFLPWLFLSYVGFSTDQYVEIKLTDPENMVGMAFVAIPSIGFLYGIHRMFWWFEDGFLLVQET